MTVNLIQAKYTSPSGNEVAFHWKDVKRSVDHATATGDYPQYNGGDTLDLGHTIEQYPLECLFFGKSYQADADAFFDALKEMGFGILDHPRWGRISVIPTAISQSEDYVDGIGRSIIEVTFISAGEEVAPHTLAIDKMQLEQTLQEAELSLTVQIELSTPSPSALVSFQASLLSPLEKMHSIMAKGWRLAGSWQASFTNLDISISAVLNAPSQMMNIMKAFLSPIKSVAQGERLQFIQQLSHLIQSQEAEDTHSASHTPYTESDNEAQKAQRSGNLFTQTLLTQTALAMAFETNESLVTREESQALLLHIQKLEQAYFQAIQHQYSRVSMHSDAMNVPLAFAMQRSFQMTKEAIMVQMSQLRLQLEKRLAHAMSLYDAMYLLYGSVNEAEMLQFISMNNLQDDEIFLLPAGRKIVYYG
ncbi:DNA circularization N-terminal domain-containing protein (plasmid) [Entomospira entomophila]|uniref:DNA circulation N-terminal domain-containing protein n=1 Tax=Entomospira entomophila TaxID=2719988 RepID=A0A968GBJ3_9SPIO|nr:DNA circularization N-terminal domain-containing protein [Entomospira entomophilus]NIZ41350.1 hypothetical protein [Entomospira entomophilus]WDI36239.1 DNA circularization N-terminal domain-containing protein [Entomospira entomophilus]